MIIAVWGSPNSGKSILSTRMAVNLSKGKFKILVIYTESMAVDIAWIYPNEKNFVSMGDIWQKDIDIDEIYGYLMAVKGYNNLAYLSYKPGENLFSYPVFTKFNVLQRLNELQKIFDYIIIDCVSDISSNMLTTVALEMADIVFRLAGTGLKDSFFFDSNLKLLLDGRFNLNRHISILSNTKYYEPSEVYRMKYDNLRYELAFDEKLYRRVLEGEAYVLFNCEYDKILNNIINKEILKQPDLKVGRGLFLKRDRVR